MINKLGTYLLSVVAISLFRSLILTIIPKGNINRIVSFLLMLLFVTVVVSPGLRIQTDTLAKSIAELRIESEQEGSGIEIKNREIIAKLIKDECEAYILDRARALGLDITAEIEMNNNEDYPFPEMVIITGSISERDQNYISQIIENDLGIPIEKQEWK